MLSLPDAAVGIKHGNVPDTSSTVNALGYPLDGTPTAVPPLESLKFDGFKIIFNPLEL